jgi:guanylate kinase
VISELLKRHSDWRVVRSYTTRAERQSEKTVKPYFFVSVDEFMHLVKSGDILEYEKYAGNWYGTSAASLNEVLATAPVVLMDLQLRGVAALKERYPQALDIYLRVSLREVRRRLSSDWHRAGTPQVEKLSRLAAVARQNRRAKHFSAVVDSVVGDIQKTVDAVESKILAAEA